MILSDVDLKKLIESGHLPQGLNVGPSSADLTLSNSFSWFEPEDGKIVLGEHVNHQTVETESFVIEPGKFILASTEEYIKVPDNMAAYVEGRSSIGRLGLQVQNASFIDGGFHGKITLELENQSGYPIELKAGIRVCQIVYFRMTSPAEKPYCGKYNGQSLATPSRLEQDPELK